MARARRAPTNGIVIDVPGVDADTRVGDLTVKQLVAVIHNVVRQTPTRPRAFDAAELEKVTEQVRALISSVKGGKPSALQRGIDDMQDAILAQLPDIAREATAQRKAERKTSSAGRAG